MSDFVSRQVRSFRLPALALLALAVGLLLSAAAGSGWAQKYRLINNPRTAGECLGYSLAVSGDTVVVGAPCHNATQGAAYVFSLPASGLQDLAPVAVLTATGVAQNDVFGYSVAISGDTILVGAHGGGSNGGANGLGAAYVFVRPPGGWTDMHQTAELTASDGAAGDYFGYAVALDGDTAVVGAFGHKLGANSQQGAAYVFTRPAGGWTDASETARLAVPSGKAYDGFGLSVALDGDTLAVGATGVAQSRGAVYVFARPPGGWTAIAPTTVLTATNGAANDELGYSIALQGDTLVAGAPYRGSSSGTSRGAAYVFTRPASGWADGVETAMLTFPDTFEMSWSVAVEGNTVVVGVPWYPGFNGSGIVLLYPKPPSGWTDSSQPVVINAPNGAENDGFGCGVAINGELVIVGDPFVDASQLKDVGAAYVFGYEPYQLYLPLVSAK